MSSRQEQEFAAYIVDLMQVVGPVAAKQMFGGHGVFLEGLMIALLAQRTLYLKTDAVTLPDFVAEGLEPFRYRKQGKEYAMSYSEAPESVFESQEAMRDWGGKAYAAALRAAAAKGGRSKACNQGRRPGGSK